METFPTIKYFTHAFLLGMATVGLRVLFDQLGFDPVRATVCLTLLLAILLFVMTSIGRSFQRAMILPNLATCVSVALVALGRMTDYPLIGTAGILLAIAYAVHALTTELDEHVSVWMIVAINATQAMFVSHWLFAS